MASRRAKNWTDSEMLEALALYDVDGWSSPRIAARFGVSRSAILGMFKRVRDESAKHFPSSDADGSLPARWWKSAGGGRS